MISFIDLKPTLGWNFRTQNYGHISDSSCPLPFLVFYGLNSWANHKSLNNKAVTGGSTSPSQLLPFREKDGMSISQNPVSRRSTVPRCLGPLRCQWGLWKAFRGCALPPASLSEWPVAVQQRAVYPGQLAVWWRGPLWGLLRRAGLWWVSARPTFL